MNTDKPKPRKTLRQSLVVALVMGSSLAAAAGGSAQASPNNPTTVKAVGDMSRYCTACWRNARVAVDQWQDCTQEVFSRLLERVSTDQWGRVLSAEGEERREFLRAIDTVKKRTQRTRKHRELPANELADHRPNSSPDCRDDRQAVDGAAKNLLSERQQQILNLSYDGWPVNAIAQELGERVERVSDEKYKAIRKLQGHFEEVGSRQ